MNEKRLWIREHLRDPMWQAIGVIVTIVISVVPFVWLKLANDGKLDTSSKPTAQIQMTSPDARNITDVSSELSSRFKVLIDGKVVNELHVLTYYFIYKGEIPLRKEDFIAPFTGVLDPGRRLLGVQKSPKVPVPRPGGPDDWLTKWNATIANRNQNQIDVQIATLNDSTFQISTPLMNPDDWFSIEVYTAAAETKTVPQTKQTSNGFRILSTPFFDGLQAAEITWTCRVAGAKCPTEFTWTNEANQEKKPSEGSVHSWVSIEQSGWSLIAILITNAGLSVLLVVFMNRSESWGLSTNKGLSLLFLMLTSSIVCAEVIVAYFAEGTSVFGQPLIAIIPTIVFLIVFAVFLVPFLGRSLKAYLNKENP